MKTVSRLKDFDAQLILSAEDTKDFLRPFKRKSRGINWEDGIFRARLDEHRTRGNQSGNVIHFRILEDAGDIVVDAVADTQDAIAEGVEIAAHDSNFEAFIDRCGKKCRGATT